MAYLFVYGTLMFPEIGSIFFRDSIGIKTTLMNYHRFRIFEAGKFKIYPAIDVRKNATVEGLIFEINEQQMSTLDEYEGDEYKRIETSINIYGAKQNVWVYVWNHTSNAQLVEEWDPKKVDRNLLKEFIYDEFD